MHLNPHKRAYDGLCRLLTPLAKEPPFDLQPEDPLWAALFQMADAHFVLPDLRAAITRLGLETRAPGAMLEALELAHHLTLERARAIRGQMLELARELAAVEVAPVWLKGAALLTEQDWERRARVMRDIDFWVPDASRQSLARETLGRLGYAAYADGAETDLPESHHDAPLAHPLRPVPVEIHRHIVLPRLEALLPDPPPERMESVNWTGLPCARLCLDGRILHSLIQCTLMSVPPLASGRLRLFKVLDLIRLLERRGRWELPPGVLAAAARPPWQKPLSRFLTLLERDFLIPNPLSPDRTYCQAVDHHLRRGRSPLRWVLGEFLRAPKDWPRLLATPGHWRSRGARRIRFLIDSLRPCRLADSPPPVA